MALKKLFFFFAFHFIRFFHVRLEIEFIANKTRTMSRGEPLVSAIFYTYRNGNKDSAYKYQDLYKIDFNFDKNGKRQINVTLKANSSITHIIWTQSREWLTNQVGWVVMLVIILLLWFLVLR